MSNGRQSEFDPASFRDRQARVLVNADGVYRALNAEGLRAWQRVSAAPSFRSLTAAGILVATEQVDPASVAISDPTLRAGLLRHSRVPFISYPYEWSFGMLKAAALVHLHLLDRLLDDGLITKDGTPYNVQWFGTRPVFVDIGSIRPMRAGEPWSGYRQFCRLFLYPLLLQARLGVPWRHWLRGSAEGIDAESCRRLLGWFPAVRPSVLAHVHLHARAERRYSGIAADIRAELRDVGFDSAFIRRTVDSLRRLIESLTWSPGTTAWTSYEPETIYGVEDAARKRTFVERVVDARTRRLAWDLGANAGAYADIAARTAGLVVACDSDESVVDHLYCRLRASGSERVLPLRLDLADPSPSSGWQQRERRPMEARGRPDLVLCLALLHHLTITAGIPLEQVVGWLASLDATLVVEFVTRVDPMVQRLLLQRDDSCDDYDLDVFEQLATRHFRCVQRLSIASGRRELFHLEPGATYA